MTHAEFEAHVGMPVNPKFMIFRRDDELWYKDDGRWERYADPPPLADIENRMALENERNT